MTPVAGLATVLLALTGSAAFAASATTLYRGRTTEVRETLTDPNDLWVRPADLPAVNDFVLKPEGACLDELCVPIRQDRDSELFIRREGAGWVCVTELARRLGQPVVRDVEHSVWSLGEVPSVVESTFLQATAPDFELLDREGRTVRLSDFRGKKVLLVTWASW